MKEYQGVLKSNTFAVKDEHVLMKLLYRTKTEHDVNFVCGGYLNDDGTFMATISLDDVMYDGENEKGENVIDAFIYNLQKILVDGTICVLTEVGHQETDWLRAGTFIVTNKKSEYISMEDVIVEYVKNKIDDNADKNMLTWHLL